MTERNNSSEANQPNYEYRAPEFGNSLSEPLAASPSSSEELPSSDLLGSTLSDPSNSSSSSPYANLELPYRPQKTPVPPKKTTARKLQRNFFIGLVVWVFFAVLYLINALYIESYRTAFSSYALGYAGFLLPLISLLTIGRTPYSMNKPRFFKIGYAILVFITIGIISLESQVLGQIGMSLEVYRSTIANYLYFGWSAIALVVSGLLAYTYQD